MSSSDYHVDPNPGSDTGRDSDSGSVRLDILNMDRIRESSSSPIQIRIGVKNKFVISKKIK